MSSEEATQLCTLLNRMVPALKKAILRDSEKRPDMLTLEIVLLSSVLEIRRESGCE